MKEAWRSSLGRGGRFILERVRAPDNDKMRFSAGVGHAAFRLLAGVSPPRSSAGERPAPTVWKDRPIARPARQHFFPNSIRGSGPGGQCDCVEFAPCAPIAKE